MIVHGGSTAELSAVAFSPDGAEVTACGSGPLFAWRAGGRRILAGGYVYRHAYTPDGRWIVAQQTADWAGGETAGVYVLDRRDERPPARLSGGWLLAAGGDRLIVRGPHPWPLLCCRAAGPDFPVVWDAATPDGAVSVAAVLPDGRVATLERPAGELRLTVRSADRGEVVAALPAGERGGYLAPSPDGQRLVLCAGTRLTAWRLADLSAAPEVAALGRREVRGVVWHPSGAYLLGVGVDGAVRRIDATTWAVTDAYQWAAGKARAVAVSPDGLTAAVATSRGKVVVFDLD